MSGGRNITLIVGGFYHRQAKGVVVVELQFSCDCIKSKGDVILIILKVRKVI